MPDTTEHDLEDDSSKSYMILLINPGSTSTKLAIFENDKESIQQTITHSADKLKVFERIIDQEQFRFDATMRFLEENRISLKGLSAVAGRGGLLKPIESGIYSVNEPMLADLRSSSFGEHASNLGGILAHRIAGKAGCPAFIIDPVVVDEMDNVARVSGMPGLERKSIFHALSQKSSAREIAMKLGRSYEDSSFIVAHLGGGISIGAHHNGRVIDVNNALDGDGPFSPERTGGLPAGQLAGLCFSGEYTLSEIRKKITGSGGLVAYRGSNSFTKLCEAAENGDEQACLLLEAMAYQVSQEITKHGATLKGNVDRIILTGGLAHDSRFIRMIEERVTHLAPIEVVPGEREMHSLAMGALSVLHGHEQLKEYTS